MISTITTIHTIVDMHKMNVTEDIDGTQEINHMIILTDAEKNSINKLALETIKMKNWMEFLQLDNGHLKVKL